MSPEQLLEAVGLKALPRAGWVRHGVPNPESVAAHSWGVAWLVMALLPPEMDRGLALAYAVLHDLPEVRVGDVTPMDGIAPAEKARREHDAASGLFAGRPDLFALWQQYERQQDPEARFVRQLDRLDLALQAVSYSTAEGPNLAEFLDSAGKFIREPALIEIFEALCRMRPHIEL